MTTTATLPPPATIAVDRVPLELRQRAQWVCWKRETRADGKPTKVPYNARTGALASTTEPNTWSSFATALRAAQRARSGYAGVGYVFAAGDPYTGVDLDHCRDAQTGALEPWALDELEAFGSYAEISPSRTGVHIIVRAVMPGGKGCHVGAYEAYDRGRFFTITGQSLDETPAPIANAQGPLYAFCAAHFGTKTPKRALVSMPASEERPGAPPDHWVELWARNDQKRGARFSALFDRGDLSAYGDDHSAADLALCNDLAYWCGPNSASQIDRLFRQSALMRDKWDSRRGDSSYSAWTIGRALEGRTAFYVWPPAEPDLPMGQEARNSPAENQSVVRDAAPAAAPCCEHLAEIARLREALRLSEEANARLRARMAWDRQVRAYPNLQPAQKLTVLAVQDVADRTARTSEQAEIPIYLPDVGKRCGRVNAEGEGAGQTAGKHLADVQNYGILEYHVAHDPADGHTHASVTPLPIMATPKAWTAPPRAPQGGPRADAGRPKRCASCGGTHLKQRTVVETICETCGTIDRQVGPDRLVNSEPEEAPESGNDAQENQTVLRPSTAGSPSVADPEHYILTPVRLPSADVGCWECGGELEGYTSSGQAYCLAHAPQQCLEAG